VRIGLFGGSFDPPHVGHWLAAVDAHDALALDRVDFIPAAQQPLKVEGGHAASATDRLAMVAAMVGDDPRFGANAIEVDRGGLSYMVDTAASYRTHGRLDELFLLVGADSASRFDRWKEPERLLSLVTLVVLTRGGEVFVPTALTRAAVVLPTRRLAVSSTEIRSRARAERPLRGFVMDAVAEYIRASALYR
jgi:nicotinate-nucleotide adenylyltransferase